MAVSKLLTTALNNLGVAAIVAGAVAPIAHLADIGLNNENGAILGIVAPVYEGDSE